MSRPWRSPPTCCRLRSRKSVREGVWRELGRTAGEAAVGVAAADADGAEADAGAAVRAAFEREHNAGRGESGKDRGEGVHCGVGDGADREEWLGELRQASARFIGLAHVSC
jgi:hypothetical protein